MRIKRAFKKALFHATRLALRPLEFAAPRKYMRIYSAILSRLGCKLKGLPRYISSGAKFDEFSLITLGDRVVISDRVVFLTHDYSITTGMIALGEKPETDVAVHRPIVIGNNVFVGLGSILLPGVEVGDNVVIAAGSVVRGKVPEDSVVAGNPAHSLGTLKDFAGRWVGRLSSFESTLDKD